MQMHISRHFYSTFLFYNPHHHSIKIFCVHTGYKANQRGHTKNTQWKQQSILVKCSLTCNLGPQPMLHDCPSFLLLVLAVHLQPPFLALLPPERQNSSPWYYKHLNRRAQRLSALCEQPHYPATDLWQSNTHAYRAVTQPHAFLQMNPLQQGVLSPEAWPQRQAVRP